MENDSKKSTDCQQVTGVVYKMTCNVNGKIYVGQTRQKLNKRINGHKHSGKTFPSKLSKNALPKSSTSAKIFGLPLSTQNRQTAII